MNGIHEVRGSIPLVSTNLFPIQHITSAFPETLSTLEAELLENDFESRVVRIVIPAAVHLYEHGVRFVLGN